MIYPTGVKAAATIAGASLPVVAQTVIDDKTAIGVLYVVAVCGFCYGAGVLVTTLKNRQKEASDSIKMMKSHFEKVDVILESIASRQCRIEEQMNALPCIPIISSNCPQSKANHKIAP